MKLVAPTKKPIKLPAINPNIGLQMRFQRELEKLIDEMQKSVSYWLKAAYKANPPRMAEDALPANVMQKKMDELAKRWIKRFNAAAPLLADYFSTAAKDRVDSQLKTILKKSGFSVEFRMTPAMRDALKANIYQQVQLIKNIPEQYMGQLQGSVMRNISDGGNLKELSEELERRYGITRRRAITISRDQIRKSFSTMNKARQTELGIKMAKLVHSHGGHTPRPTHLAMDGKLYEVAKGFWDEDAHGKGKGAWVQPGELPNCKCTSASVIPGFE